MVAAISPHQPSIGLLQINQLLPHSFRETVPLKAISGPPLNPQCRCLEGSSPLSPEQQTPSSPLWPRFSFLCSLSLLCPSTVVILPLSWYSLNSHLQFAHLNTLSFLGMLSTTQISSCYLVSIIAQNQASPISVCPHSNFLPHILSSHPSTQPSNHPSVPTGPSTAAIFM